MSLVMEMSLKLFELVLSDIDGTRVQATINAFLISKVERHLSEGDLIYIQKFSVIDRPRSYPVTAFPYKIVFQQDTLFGTHVNRKFPRSVFQFRSIPDIKSQGSRDDAGLFDVIGHVVCVDAKMMAPDIPNKSVQIVIGDLKKNKLVCVLWAPYCREFEGCREKCMKPDRYFGIIVQLCRSKILRNGQIGISNAYSATKLILDQDLDEIADFVCKLPPNEANINFDGS